MTPVCSLDAQTCNAGVPQKCVVDSLGCPSWATQPPCSANQTCLPATGLCTCNPQPQCGAAGAEVEGDFCPTAGLPSHATCTQGADRCFTVTTSVACAGAMTCNITPASTVVPTGTACGCPPAVAAPSATTPLLGTGCTMVQATAGTRLGSAADAAVLACVMVNGCPIWQISTNCASQQLTGGTDPLTTLPACVCRPPTIPNQYYVDPDPTMSTFMTGVPTGAQFPAACRFVTLTTALAQPGVTVVIAQHESSSNVHFLTRVAVPTGCTTPNSCEIFPLAIASGVRVSTSDAGSLNPAHYVIDVNAIDPSLGYAVTLATGATFEGYTVDASGSGAANAASGVAQILASPAMGTATATVNQVLLLGRSGQVGLAVLGQSSWNVSYLSVQGASTGILIDRSTDVTGAVSLTANHLNVSSPLAGAVGVEVGTGLAADAFVNLVVANDASDTAAARGIRVGAGGTGVRVNGGSATFTGVDVASASPTAAVLTGYQILNSNAPAPVGLNIRQGSILGSDGGGVGLDALGGLATVAGTHIGGGAGWTGVRVRSTDDTSASTLAGNVTLTGTATAKTVIDASPPTNTTATVGVVVGSGLENPASSNLSTLTIADDTTVTGYTDGLVVNNGHVVATGAGVAFTANQRDGLQVFSTLNLAGTNPMDPLSRVSVSGATISNNGRLGVLIRDVAPVALTGVKVNGNGTPLPGGPFAQAGGFPEGTGGIDVQRSQLNGNTAFLFSITGNSQVSGNTGCGLTISGGASDLVNRPSVSSDVGATRICGVGIAGVTGPIVGTFTGIANIPDPIVASVPNATNVGGKVSADIENTLIQNNTGVGLYITEARDFDPSGGATPVDDVTEVSLEGNTITGNLTVVPADGAEPAAGGVYVASSNYTAGSGTPLAPIPPSSLNALGCEAAGSCTQVRIATFLGNTVACNGRAQLAFAIPQRVNNTANGAGWDISSSGTIVNLTDRCAAAALPNTLAGYGSGVNLGLAIPASATTVLGLSLIDVAAFALRWQVANPVAGTDYSSGLAAAPQGNDDASTWGICPASPVTCPVAVAP